MVEDKTNAQLGGFALHTPGAELTELKYDSVLFARELR
jgi:hypothetical protein